MAIGDRIPTEVVEPTAITASAATYFTNAGASYRTQITGISLVNTGATQRSITLYKNGTATSNQIANAIVIPAGGSVILDYVGKPHVFTNTQTFSAKQDTGTDVTLSAVGIVEQIA